MISIQTDRLTSQVSLRGRASQKKQFERIFKIYQAGKYIGASMRDAVLNDASWVVTLSDCKNLFIKLATVRLPKVTDASPGTQVCLDLIANK